MSLRIRTILPYSDLHIMIFLNQSNTWIDDKAERIENVLVSCHAMEVKAHFTAELLFISPLTPGVAVRFYPIVFSF